MSFENWSLPDLCLAGVLGLYALLIAADFIRPARSFESVRFWRLKGVASFAVYFLIASNLPLVTDAFLAEHRWIDASGLGVGWGAVVGLLVLELGVYVWHRTLHTVPAFWRWLHQTHHSAERVDIWGAMYFHPLDTAAFTLLGSVILVGVVGVVPEAALIAGSVAWALAIFQHANVETPRWLGYLVARPESHSRHHERGVHAGNYSDLPIWDIVFGTFDNPPTWHGKAGFYAGGSGRMLDLLVGRDVSTGTDAKAALMTSTSRPSAEPISS
jgi:sterol desaturase/sphingolipid hydroxylase (fatty acid hydroxylase superfamily)